jgi:hypothetical protein
MKRAFFLSIVLMLLASAAFAQVGFYGSVRNSVYAYESEKAHTRVYQYVRLNAISPCKKFTAQTSMRALTDVNETLDSEDRFKLYSLRFNGKGLLNESLDFSIGRLFLHPGTTLGALDGATVTYSFANHFAVTAYGGLESHFKRSFNMYETTDSQVLGGLFTVQKYFKSKLQLLYLRKANENATFWHLTGLNFDTALLPKTLLRVQSHYDIEQSRMHRLLVSARNTWTSKVMTTLEYKQQLPQVYANSYFTFFTPEAYQRIRFGAAYEFIPNYNFQLNYQYVMFENDNASQIYATVGNTFADIGLVFENGYAGDQVGVMVDLFYEVLPNLVASVYVDYSQYRVEKVYEYDNQLANAARLSYRLGRHLTIDAEYQWLQNRFQSSDSRFLNHISFVW